MIPEKILINLKIISHIQKNEKLTKSFNGFISIDHQSSYQFIKRFIFNDSRNHTVSEINSILNETHLYISELLKSNNKHLNLDILNILYNELSNCINGISNLKFTYQDDLNISSQLDIIILKFQHLISLLHPILYSKIITL
jgi:hypothetical protein